MGLIERITETRVQTFPNLTSGEDRYVKRPGIAIHQELNGIPSPPEIEEVFGFIGA